LFNVCFIYSFLFVFVSFFLFAGSKDGKIKVWQIIDGICTRKFDSAHSQVKKKKKKNNQKNKKKET